MNTLIPLAALLLAAPQTAAPDSPIERPMLFAPGVVSTGLSERDGSRSVDGGTFAFTIQSAAANVIVLTERTANGWGEPEVAPFSGHFADIEPAFDPRGGRLLFASRRPLAGVEPGDWNLWSVDFARGANGLEWSAPAELEGVNGPGEEFYPSIAKTGELVFTAERPGGAGGEDLWLARPEGAGWTVRNAGRVNTPGPEFNACLSPDATRLVFSSVRPGDQGGGDLYVSARAEDGRFGPARALTALNSPQLDYCPTFSADGTTLWFTSNRPVREAREGRWTLAELRAALEGPGNGQGDVWWVLASTLAE